MKDALRKGVLGCFLPRLLPFNFEIKKFRLTLLCLLCFNGLSFAQVDYLMSISKGEQINDNTYEFDIFINSITSDFELTSYQSSFNFNQDIINDGRLFFSYLEGTSELSNPPMLGLGLNTNDGNPELTFASMPGQDNISSQTLRVGRFRLQNTNSFGGKSPDITWNFDGNIATILTGTNFINITNPSNHSSEQSTDVKNEEVKIPQEFELSQNYPNPFNPSTKIQFGLKQNANVKLAVYNILGEEVVELINGDMKAGIHEVELYTSDLTDNQMGLSSGVYVYRLDVNNEFSDSKKMVLMK